MTKTKTKLIVLLAFVLAFSLTFYSCGKEDSRSNEETKAEVSLAAPQNLRVEEEYLIWDPVENALGYTIYFNNKKRQTTETSYDLSELTEDATYTIQVKAFGDGEDYIDSEWVLFSYKLVPPIQVGYTEYDFEYTLLEDGTGYKISKGNVDVVNEIALIIPDYYRGLPVKEIAHDGFAAYKVSGISMPTVNVYTGQNCNPTTKIIHLPEKLESIGNRAFIGNIQLEEIIIPDTVTKIGVSAFEACKNLKKVKLPSTLKELPQKCFAKCGLTEISFPDTLEKIGFQAFIGGAKDGEYVGQSFTKLVLPSSIKEIGYQAFYYCFKLNDIVLPSDSDLNNLGYDVFKKTAWHESQPDGILYLNHILYGYKGIMPEDTSIQVPGIVKYIASQAFYEQINLKSIYIPDGVKFAGEKIFGGCTSLSEVRLPSDLTEIPKLTFWKCSSLTQVEIPNSVAVIANAAFSGCPALKTIAFPQNLEKIFGGAFLTCTQLRELIIPKSVNELGSSVFSQCDSLASIYYEGSIEEWNALVSWYNPTEQARKPFSDATIYYYSETKPTGSGNYWHYIDGKAVIWD